MPWATKVSALAACIFALPLIAVDLPGRLQLADAGPWTTPIESLDVSVRSEDGHTSIRAGLDKDGRFVLRGMVPGRYTFDLGVPARFVSVALGGRTITPPGFELTSKDRGPLEIVISMKGSELSVTIRGLPGEGRKVRAVLCPADSYLTLQNSCFANPVSGSRTKFLYLPPGTYRLFIADEALTTDISAYGTRVERFLRSQAPPVDVAREGETNVTATYIDAATVRQEIEAAGPLEP